MENIIKKAIEGGWRPNNILNEVGTLYSLERGHFDKKKIILDPLFWQSLGKACGRDKRVCKGCGSPEKQIDGEYHLICPKCNRGGESRIDMHLFHALRFHEINLTEGWSKAVEYLEDLVKNNETKP